MSGVGNSQNTDAGTAASASSTVRGRLNYPGRRNDPGWKHGVDVLGIGKNVRCNYCHVNFWGGINRFKTNLACFGGYDGRCISVPDDVMQSYRQIVSEAEDAQNKNRQLIDISAENDVEVEVARRQIQSKGKGLLSLTSKGKSSGGGVQQHLNEMLKKDLKEQAYDEIAEFFFTNGLSFNVGKNHAFVKMLETVGRYGCGFKQPSYNDIREKLLKRVVARTHEIRDEFKEEWKKTGCTIMSDRWTDRKRHSICNFMVNSPKGTLFLYSLDTSDNWKTTDKVSKMLEDAINYVGAEIVVQVVTDNAANYKAAGEKLMQTNRSFLLDSVCGTLH
ncbi:uncharacterized protein LOC130719342 [Lotus japonicus]|uniref:uncharacterized protein LOC130719342 n=1 Tax=Lotus japonicus TaxID=34305 RepID=UPI0025890F31|nr:uncharacterized protein LOC130719342 [Lotus japonicus]